MGAGLDFGGCFDDDEALAGMRRDMADFAPEELGPPLEGPDDEDEIG